MAEIRFLLNGQEVTYVGDPGRSLLTVLREDFDVIGPKQACDGEGECGACAVLLDGEAVRSCLIPVGKVAGRQVITIEGLGSDDRLHPLQQAFIEYGAVQCGYCTPGMIISAAALLLRDPRPSRQRILEELGGNLCRCTGYNTIIAAVEAAAAMMRGETPPPPALPHHADGRPYSAPIIGKHLTRVDAIAKVTGKARYAEDIKMPGMLYATITRSPHPHARVLRIDTTPAERMPGVVKVLTAQDIPGHNDLDNYSLDEHVLAFPGDSVRMIGDAVAVVVAETMEQARAAADAVQVEYEILPHTFDQEEALSPDFPSIHAGGNILDSYEIHFGELEPAMAQADLRLETQYETVFMEHSALERETVVGYWDENEVLTLIAGTQEPHWARDFTAWAMGLPQEKVRVITPPMGGAFGGKQDPWPVIAGALAAYYVRRPVRLAYTRHESFNASPKRHPYRMRYQVGARKDGALTGLHLRILANTGAYDSAGRWIPQYALVAGGGPYRWEAVDAVCHAIYTNGPKAGQMRGFGTPQSMFALECTLDELAERLGMDPLELRLRNALDGQTTTFLGYPPAETFAYRECLESIRPHYRAALAAAEEYNRRHAGTPWRRGVGLAGMWYRFGKSGDPRCPAEAELREDGTLAFYFSAPDYGQGTSTVMLQLAAETLGIPVEYLEFVNADTGLTPDSGIQGASRSTYWVGGAVHQAARTLKEQIFAMAAEMLEAPPDQLTLTPASVKGPNGQEVTLAEIARQMKRAGWPLRVRGVFAPNPTLPKERPEYLPFFATGVQFAEVDVNIETGEVKVVRMVAVHDVGRAINPQSVLGQIEGAIVMGMGAALEEEFIPGVSTGFSNYYLPVAVEVPKIEVYLVEVASNWGPMGAKGLGEMAILASTPAIINGIYRASGGRVRKLPATPERVRQAIQEARKR